MSFLAVEDKNFLVVGVANRKSVAYHIAGQLEEAGARVIYSVRSQARKASVQKLVPENADIFVCDVEKEGDIQKLADRLAAKEIKLHGLVHSVAFANFEAGLRPFHETRRQDFLQTVDVSCYSLIDLANACKDLFVDDASVITISISTTQMASENYGWMAPAKAALDSSVCFLAKSFSRFSNIRFNAVCPSLLKTSASAGIPGYMDSYLYAEKAMLRGKALQTSEVAKTALFLLSPASSGINGQHLVVDGGMRLNYFDRQIIDAVVDKHFA